MRVGIVGLGLAGLRTAMLLERAGLEVSLFDARDRIGGRASTVEDPGHALHEAGPEWIDADHLRMLALLDELDLVPRPRPSGVGHVRFKGLRTTDADLWSDARADEEFVEAEARELTRALGKPPWSNRQAADLDRQTVSEFIRARVHSDRGMFWLDAKYRTDEGDDLDRVGVLGWLVGFALYAGRKGDEMGALRLPGSTAELCRRMLVTVRARPVLRSALRAVHHEGAGVVLRFDDGREVTVDRAVIAIPAPCLADLEFTPALDPSQRAAIAACRFGRTVKICWEFEEAWWRADGWSGALTCDGPLQRTWDASIDGAAVLCAYVVGQQAVAWTRRTNPVREGLASLAEMYPSAARTFVRGCFHDWIHEPYSHGSHSHFQPGFVLTHMEHLARPTPRVHFAGEHTATWSGFMEGALESADRVTAEILGAGEP